MEFNKELFIDRLMRVKEMEEGMANVLLSLSEQTKDYLKKQSDDVKAMIADIHNDTIRHHKLISIIINKYK